jgi:xylulokinase
MIEHVCSLDLGTTHIKAALVDAEGTITAMHRLDAPPCITDTGGFEFDADEYVDRVRTCIAHVLERVPRGSVAAVTSSSQRATVVPVGRDGLASAPALSWQDGRGERAIARVVEPIGARRYAEITGLPPSALWTLAKVLWLREAAPRRAAARFALLNDYVLARLGSDGLVTDSSNASLTGMLDLSSLRWSAEVLGLAGVEAEQLPEVRPPASRAGVVSREASEATGLPAGTPLVLGGGDQQCAALGAGACDPGDAALCVGTAAVASCPTDAPTFDDRGRWFCTAHVVPGRWVLEGIHNAFGSSIGWVCDLLGLAGPAELESLAARDDGPSGDVVFLPFLAGIGSPDFDASAAGALTGLRLPVTRARVARAVLEGVGLEVRRILDSMAERVSTRRLRIVGGASGTLASQVLADMTGRSLGVSPVAEASLLGAAVLAWTEAGRFESVRAGAARWTGRETTWLEPRDAAAGEKLERYRRMVGSLRNTEVAT